MSLPRRRPARRPGIAVVIAAAAVAAGLTASGPAAQAGPVTHQVECTPGGLDGAKFTWEPQIELTLAPQKAYYNTGDKVTVTWKWKTPPRNPSSWRALLINSSYPTGTVALSGAQSGEVKLTGEKKHATAGGNQPIYVPDMTGEFTIAKEGRIDLSPAGYDIHSILTPSNPCVPKGTPPIAAGLQVGKPPTTPPATTGGATGGTTGGTSGGTAGGASGGTTAGGNPPQGSSTSGSSTGTPPPATTGGGSTVGGTTGGTTPAPTTTVDPVTGQPVPAGTPGAVTVPVDQVGQPTAGTPLPPAGPLSMTPSKGVELSGFTPGSLANGKLDPVVIRDQRGSTLGWTLTGQLSDFVAPDGQRITADKLTWIPACVAAKDGDSRVVSGVVGVSGSGAKVLCAQSSSNGGVTGGEFTANASLDIPVPPGTLAPSYSADLTLSLS